MSSSCGILDSASPFGQHSGCPELLEAGTQVRTELHVLGHIHGLFRTEHTTFVNAARLGLHDAADKPPFRPSDQQEIRQP